MNAQHRTALAARLTQRWVRVYTAHLDPARRDTRRAELASDLWEHEAEAKRRGLGSLRVNAQILRRLLAGMPADLSWRRQPPDPTPVLAAPAPQVATLPSSPWACRLRGHRYVTKRLSNNLDEGGFYHVCGAATTRNGQAADLLPTGFLEVERVDVTAKPPGAARGIGVRDLSPGGRPFSSIRHHQLALGECRSWSGSRA